jgi:hypothetical protein
VTENFQTVSLGSSLNKLVLCRLLTVQFANPYTGQS